MRTLALTAATALIVALGQTATAQNNGNVPNQSPIIDQGAVHSSNNHQGQRAASETTGAQSNDYADEGDNGWAYRHHGDWRGWHHWDDRNGMHNRFPRWRAWRNTAARFRFARGNARIDIKCPTDQDVQVCVRAASQLIRQVMSMGKGAANPAPSAQPSPPTPGQSPPAVGGRKS